MLTFKRFLLAVVAVAFAVAVAGCSDDGKADEPAPPTSALSADDIVFGSGEFPDTIPDGFPLPAGSSIGSTMLVTKTGFTEVIVTIGFGPAMAVQFFEQELPKAGFSVDGSANNNGLWLIEFSNDGANGTIDLSEPIEDISQAVIRYNVP